MRKLLLILFALYVVVGCGGGGGSKGTGVAPNAQTRQSVKEGVAHSLMGVAQAGMGGGSVSSTGGTGGGIGFPMIGSFLYQFLPSPGGAPPSPAMALRHRVSPMEVGTTGSGTDGGGGGTDPEFYYDEYLGLWVDMVSTETSYTVNLFVDEAKSEPAGSFQSTFPSGWDTYPYSLNSTFSITAGNLAGAHGQYSMVIENESKGHSTFESVWPKIGSDTGETSWNGGANTWKYESHSGDLWWKGDGGFTANGSGSSAFSDSAGYTATYIYHSDGSGSGRITGPDAGLPATITWTSSGHVKIVYADGSVEEWDPSDYYGSGDVGGTTGTGTGTSTGNQTDAGGTSSGTTGSGG